MYDNAAEASARVLHSPWKFHKHGQSGTELSELLPTVSVTDSAGPGSAFRTITVIAPMVEGAQGVLEADQGSPAAAIALAASPCPNVSDVCGFVPGTTAMIVSGDGTHDVFVIGATIAAARWLTPNHTLSRAYPAGSVVIEVEQDTFRLADQPNGSRSLIRETAAGAVQPIVDFVTDLSFDVQGENMPAGFFRLGRYFRKCTQSSRLTCSRRSSSRSGSV